MFVQVCICLCCGCVCVCVPFKVFTLKAVPCLKLNLPDTFPHSVAGSKEMILIDALVHSAGDPLAQLWKNEEGSGMYPPPSLHVSEARARVILVVIEGERNRQRIVIQRYREKGIKNRKPMLEWYLKL